MLRRRPADFEGLKTDPECCQPKTVQYLAGHEDSKVTMDIYAKAKYNKPEELSSVVNNALKKPVKSKSGLKAARRAPQFSKR